MKPLLSVELGHQCFEKLLSDRTAHTHHPRSSFNWLNTSMTSCLHGRNTGLIQDSGLLHSTHNIQKKKQQRPTVRKRAYVIYMDGIAGLSEITIQRQA